MDEIKLAPCPFCGSEDVKLNRGLSMSIVFLAKGTFTLGRTTRDESGDTIWHNDPRFEVDPDGGSVLVGELDSETMEQKGESDLFSNWDAAGYLSKAMELLKLRHRVNLPDFEGITKRMARTILDRNCPFLNYCQQTVCADCIVQNWCDECEEEEGISGE